MVAEKDIGKRIDIMIKMAKNTTWEDFKAKVIKEGFLDLDSEMCEFDEHFINGLWHGVHVYDE